MPRVHKPTLLSLGSVGWLALRGIGMAAYRGMGDQGRMGVAKHRNRYIPLYGASYCCDAWQHMVGWPTMTRPKNLGYLSRKPSPTVPSGTLASLLQHHLPQGTGLRALASVLNCAPSHLLRLARGERWAHLDAAYEYVRVLRARHANPCPVCEAHTPEVVLLGELNGRLRRDGVRAEVLSLRLLPRNGAWKGG